MGGEGGTERTEAEQVGDVERSIVVVILVVAPGDEQQLWRIAVVFNRRRERGDEFGQLTEFDADGELAQPQGAILRANLLADLSTIRPIGGLIGERARCRGLQAFMEHGIPRARSNRNQTADRPDC